LAAATFGFDARAAYPDVELQLKRGQEPIVTQMISALSKPREQRKKETERR
jgi:hypothetical protein